MSFEEQLWGTHSGRFCLIAPHRRRSSENTSVPPSTSKSQVIHFTFCLFCAIKLHFFITVQKFEIRTVFFFFLESIFLLSKNAFNLSKVKVKTCNRFQTNLFHILLKSQSAPWYSTMYSTLTRELFLLSCCQNHSSAHSFPECTEHQILTIFMCSEVSQVVRKHSLIFCF